MSAFADSSAIKSAELRSPYTSFTLGYFAATLDPLLLFLTKQVISQLGCFWIAKSKKFPPTKPVDPVLGPDKSLQQYGNGSIQDTHMKSLGDMVLDSTSKAGLENRSNQGILNFNAVGN